VKTFFFSFFRERWFLGEKNTAFPVKIFFYFLFLENACCLSIKQSNFVEEPYFAMQTDSGAFGLAPACPKLFPGEPYFALQTSLAPLVLTPLS